MNGIMKSSMSPLSSPTSAIPMTNTNTSASLSTTTTTSLTKERKKHDRFNGMPEDEVSKRTLPDYLANNLDIIIVSLYYNIMSSN